MKIKNSKKLFISLGIFITILLVLVFSINLILGSIIRHSIDGYLDEYNNNSNKEYRVDKINFNLWTKSITLKNISIAPDSILFEQLKHGEVPQVSIMEINIPVVKLKGLEVFDLIMNRNFSLNKIVVNGAAFTIYKNKFKSETDKTNDVKSNVSIDSIYVNGLNSINLSKIEFDLFSYTIINVLSDDTIFSFRGNEFEINGLALEKTNASGDFFRFNTRKLSLKMNQQQINLRHKNYFISLRELDFSYSDNLIKATGFKIKPTRNKYKLGASFKYTKEIIEVDIKSINVFGYKIGKALRRGIIDIDSVLIDGLNIDVYKDRHKPFNTDERPLFIQQQLKRMKQPLHIKKIQVTNGNFVFSLLPENRKKLMQVDINNIDADISFITSIKDSLQSGKQLRVNVNGILMGASPLRLNIIMPYNSPADTFYFSGELGKGDFTKFNSALYPVTGIKFNGGQLNSLKFYAHANPNYSYGLMTMLYENLEAEIPKKDSGKRNKFLSFTANTVLRTSNPSKRKKPRIALVKTNRVEYKGFGNLLWKTVQSGLINTIIPTGNTHKEAAQFRKHEKKKSSKKNKKRK